MDIASIIEKEKQNFTRDRKSVIKEYLNKNNKDIVISQLNKARGASVKFYYIKDGKIVYNDYCEKNAAILIKALEKNNIKIVNIKDIKA